jgi:hypothetical protein
MSDEQALQDVLDDLLRDHLTSRPTQIVPTIRCLHRRRAGPSRAAADAVLDRVAAAKQSQTEPTID